MNDLEFGLILTDPFLHDTVFNRYKQKTKYNE